MRGVDPFQNWKEVLRDYLGGGGGKVFPPRPHCPKNHKREREREGKQKIQEKSLQQTKKSPGKGHTSRYEADDEDDDGEPKGT